MKSHNGCSMPWPLIRLLLLKVAGSLLGLCPSWHYSPLYFPYSTQVFLWLSLGFCFISKSVLSPDPDLVLLNTNLLHTLYLYLTSSFAPISHLFLFYLSFSPVNHSLHYHLHFHHHSLNGNFPFFFSAVFT